MVTSLAHFSVVFLIFLLFPNLDLASLIIGALIIDAEYILIFLKEFIRTRNIKKSFMGCTISIGHSALGALIIWFPLGLLITNVIGLFQTTTIISLAIGMLTHLIADLPGHADFLLLWPKKILNNPFKRISTKKYLLMSNGISAFAIFFIFGINPASAYVLGLVLIVELLVVYIFGVDR